MYISIIGYVHWGRVWISHFLFWFLCPQRKELKPKPTASLFIPYLLLSIGKKSDLSDSSWFKNFTEIKFTSGGNYSATALFTTWALVWQALWVGLKEGHLSGIFPAISSECQLLCWRWQVSQVGPVLWVYFQLRRGTGNPTSAPGLKASLYTVVG